MAAPRRSKRLNSLHATVDACDTGASEREECAYRIEYPKQEGYNNKKLRLTEYLLGCGRGTVWCLTQFQGEQGINYVKARNYNVGIRIGQLFGWDSNGGWFGKLVYFMCS